MDLENMNIEKATERCKALTNPEQGCWIGISNQKAIETVLEELEKKDKVINEMAKYLDAEDATETFCEGQEEADCIADCINCIKEYFTNKVEREGK